MKFEYYNIFILLYFIMSNIFGLGISDAESRQKDNPNYFPMHTGNIWQSAYEIYCWDLSYCQKTLKTISIGEKTIINDTTYFYLTMNDIEYPWRYDRDENRLYFRVDNEERLHMDFNMQVDSVFYQGYPGWSCLRYAKIIEGYIAIFGAGRYCKGYSFLGEDFETEDVLYAENLGFVSLVGEYYGSGPDFSWSEDLLSAKIYSDSSLITYAVHDSPWIEGNDIPQTYGSQYFADEIDIYSNESRFCHPGSFIDYIDSAVVEIYYSQGPIQTSIQSIPMNHIPQSISWNYFLNLNPLYFQNGYALNLRFKVWNKSYNNLAYYIPMNGWYNMEYEEPTGVTEDFVPMEYSLSQNFPNPFNPSTTISYSLAGEAYVKMEVFDILGNSVACLVNKLLPAGQYSVKFCGEGLSSGIYLLKISMTKSGSQIFSNIKKMIFLK